MTQSEQGKIEKHTMTNIRLSAQEIDGLHAAFVKVLAPLGAVEVYLFGSRAFMDKKGGDIDLLIVCETKPAEDVLRLTRRLWIAIEENLGERKVDVVWDVPGNDNAFAKMARQDGVLIWHSAKPGNQI